MTLANADAGESSIKSDNATYREANASNLLELLDGGEHC